MKSARPARNPPSRTLRIAGLLGEAGTVASTAAFMSYPRLEQAQRTSLCSGARVYSHFLPRARSVPVSFAFALIAHTKAAKGFATARDTRWFSVLRTQR